jgi:hypothetical protein
MPKIEDEAATARAGEHVGVYRLVREIGRLEHPNIARMYDAGIDESGRPFIAMGSAC